LSDMVDESQTCLVSVLMAVCVIKFECTPRAGAKRQSRALAGPVLLGRPRRFAIPHGAAVLFMVMCGAVAAGPAAAPAAAVAAAGLRREYDPARGASRPEMFSEGQRLALQAKANSGNAGQRCCHGMPLTLGCCCCA
jgi:hypothetical protein